VCRVAFGLDFVIMIVRFDTPNGRQGRKNFVLLGCEKGDNYRKYKLDMDMSVTGTRKC